MDKKIVGKIFFVQFFSVPIDKQLNWNEHVL